MLFELCIICFMVFALWIIGKLLMLYDIVHVPKKRIHFWRHVKYLNHVSSTLGRRRRRRKTNSHNKMFNICFYCYCHLGMLLFHMRNNVNVQRFLL